jgi:hypothetical protein
VSEHGKELVVKRVHQSLYGWRIMPVTPARSRRQVGLQLGQRAGKSIDRSPHSVARHAGSGERMCARLYVTLDVSFGKQVRACDQHAQGSAHRLAFIGRGHLQPSSTWRPRYAEAASMCNVDPRL